MKLDAMVAAGQRDHEVYRHFLVGGPASAVAVIGGDTPAANATPDDVTDWLRRLNDRGVKPRHPRAHLHAAFAHAMAADYDPTRPVAAVRFGIRANPVTSVGGPRTSGVRERFLAFEELGKVWHGFGGADIAPTITAAILGIIAMGGIRVEEVAFARGDQLFERDGRTWIAWAKTKNGRAQELPVTSHALEIFTWSKRMTGNSPFLFPSPGRDDAHITGNALPRAVRRWCETTEMEPWQPRDLRRTMKTHLNDRHPDLRAIGAVDMWHNHGLTAGVSGRHYDRATYTDPKLAVATAIDGLLDNLPPDAS
ncbi:tyrosine-type recombinase/integrase [Acuticoccus mangrovi]|uniref:Tyrosine-type recombinase/integrase n=1 Tax=Acuticoccus mangrovi TaxID=2796142 RepID=A0A934IGS7_9HYPH|nr:tyrosine-type recombinase/integrase [Acuticoccus mangrovi]MBJ3776419.1 tyrosine-type recombinase/integrase [Acuticoccus mangrovi]